MSHINKELKKTIGEEIDEYNNFSGSGSNDEYATKNQILKEEKKRYTKPSIVRLEYKTRYNSSKIVK